jgi:hypothetical protein
VRALLQVNGKYLISSQHVNSFVAPCFVSPVPTRTLILPRHAGMATGQAAGMCTALAARLGKPPRAVPVSDVWTELPRQGANLGCARSLNGADGLRKTKRGQLMIGWLLGLLEESVLAMNVAANRISV